VKNPACETAFPTLTEAELACVSRIGTSRTFQDGEVLIEIGDLDFPFYAVRSGEIVILESSTGEPHEVVVHGPGQFSGDVSMLTGAGRGGGPRPG
jgi:thioredoxin reductase (NADPH)